MRVLLFILFQAAFLGACAQPLAPKTSLKFGGKVVILADSLESAHLITIDQTDRFFDRITLCEMSIQMKSVQPFESDRAEAVRTYRAFLRADVADFTDAEAKFVGQTMEKVYRAANLVNPHILPDTLYLLKTKGNHYGDGVYYTRENTIVIPQNELRARKNNPFTTTLFHELFHVYSRLNPSKRRQLYQLIGFETLGADKLKMPEALASRVLHNPDGVDFSQKIDLRMEDSTKISAIPIIYSRHDRYKAGQDAFFSYLEFNLYKIEPDDSGRWRVVTAEDGYSSLLKVENCKDFFRQIRDNTGYIIHPDEVLADNFAFVMMEKIGVMMTMKFSEEGKLLLRKLESVLKTP